MNAVALPQYTPSDRAPSYAAEPRGGEERLAFAAVSATLPDTTRRPSIPTDCLPTSPKGARIVLERWRQEDPSVAPIYRQNEIVRGEVVLDSPADSVSIRLEAEQVVSAELARGNVHYENILFSVEHELRQSQHRFRAPSRLEFAIPFPDTFTNGQATLPIPPSFNGRFPGIPSIRAYVSYTLTAVITDGPFTERTHCELIFYRPQSSPPMPTPERGPPFLSLTKQVPEEWYQITTSIPSRTKRVGAIDCHLFIPAGRTYPIQQGFPFQLQLRAPINHLLALQGTLPMNEYYVLGPSTCANSAAGSSTSAKYGVTRRSLSMLGTPLRTGKVESRESPRVRVYLQRRLVINMDSSKEEWQGIPIGESTMTSMTTPDGEDTLAWDGRFGCLSSPNTVTSGFSTGQFEVKDFIVIHIKPSNPDISPWQEHIYAHPIHLVTDSYQEYIVGFMGASSP